MHFHIITLFPKAFDSYLSESILKRAIEDKMIKVSFYNPRDFADDKPTSRRGANASRGGWARVDRPPYGGGPGMVIQALPVIKAIDASIKKITNYELRMKKTRNSKLKIRNYKIIWLTPSGKQFTNEYASKTAKRCTDLVVVCGRYEGIDARVKKAFKMDEISVGSFVLTGGELPAMLMIDVISRQVKGVLGNFDSIEEKRVASSDVYTRPEVITHKGKKYRVPKILLSGHHAKIEDWKKKR